MLVEDMLNREGVTDDLRYGESVEETLRWVSQFKQELVWLASDRARHISVRCKNQWVCTVYPSGIIHYAKSLVEDNWDFSLCK